ncbi:MAG: hypothetical protein ACP5VE_10785 [Chthonomonadales bacterium]
MSEAVWVRPATDTGIPIWGFRNGIRVGIWPGGFEGGDGGPRGLLRIGYPILNDGRTYGLINFIAIEPVVQGRRGYSELERSRVDGQPGKMIYSTGTDDARRVSPGEIVTHDGRERLRVALRVEPFLNGAQPVIRMEFRREAPDEVCLSAHAGDKSAAMEFCILTATMGNYERLRCLWLRDRVVMPQNLWPAFWADGFSPDAFIPSDRIPRNRYGDLILAATPNEADPGAVPPDVRAPWWAYRGSFPVTQYWRMERGNWRQDVRARVNARRVYWGGRVPIPGGPAFENVELVQNFTSNPAFCFGVTRRKPPELGLDLPSAL